LIQIETQTLLKLLSKMPIYAEKMCICALCWNMQKYGNKICGNCLFT